MAGTQGVQEELFRETQEDKMMLRWALTFFLLALIAAFLGFFAMAGLAAEIAKLLLLAFVVLLVISLITGTMRGRSPPA